jgi:hypothetical protein
VKDMARSLALDSNQSALLEAAKATTLQVQSATLSDEAGRQQAVGNLGPTLRANRPASRSRSCRWLRSAC